MAHIFHKLDYTAEAFIVFENKVLLRKHDKYKIWLSVGGHIEIGEDPCEAAIREAKEEVGLDITLVDEENLEYLNEPGKRNLIRAAFINRHQISDTHEHLAFIYIAESKTDKLFLEEGDVECKWCTLDEIEALDITPQIKFYAKRALERCKKEF